MTDSTQSGGNADKRAAKTVGAKAIRPARRRRTQGERSAETTAKLLDAAVQVLLEKGYSGFRIGDAAERAGISRGGQLHHFATKNELIEASIAHMFESEVVQSQADASLANDDSVMSAAAEHAREFLQSDLFRLSFNLLVSLPRDIELADRLRNISRASRPTIEDAWVGRLVKLGLDATDATSAVGALWSVQRGFLATNHLGFPESVSSSGSADFAEALLAKHIAHGINRPAAGSRAAKV